MNDGDDAGAAACGACVSIQGPEGQSTVTIVDRCPGCPQGDIDLSEAAFVRTATAWAVEGGLTRHSWAQAETAVCTGSGRSGHSVMKMSLQLENESGSWQSSLSRRHLL